MDLQNITFKNISSTIPYHHDEEINDYVYLSKPILQIIHATFVKKSIREVRDKLLRGEPLYSLDKQFPEIYVGSPLVYTYVSIILATILLLLIPFAIYITIRKRFVIDGSKYTFFFATECLLLVFMLVGLIVSCTMSLQSAIQLQAVMVKYPNVLNNAFKDITQQIEIYKDQVQDMHGNVMAVSETVANLPYEFPDKMQDLTKKEMDPELEGYQNASERIFAQIRRTFCDSGLVHVNGTKTHGMEIAAKHFKNGLNSICRMLNSLQLKLSANNNLSKELRQSLSYRLIPIRKECYIPNHDLTFPKWDLVHDDFVMLLNEMMPKMSDLAHFDECIPRNVTCNVKGIFKPLHDKAKQNEVIMDNTSFKLLKLVENILPTFCNNGIIKNAMIIASRITYLNALSGKCKFGYYSIRVVLIIPILIGLLIAIIIITGLYYVPKDMDAIQKSFTAENESPSRITSVAIFKAAVIICILNAWFWILMSGLLFASALFLHASCQIVSNTKYLGNFLDNQPEWQNNTAVSFWIKSLIEDDNIPQIKLEEVLRNCKENRTFYQSLNLDKIWNLTAMMDWESIVLESAILEHRMQGVAENFQLQRLQNYREEIIDKLKTIDKELNISFINSIKRDFELMNGNDQSHKIESIIKILPRDSNFDFLYEKLQWTLDTYDKLNGIHLTKFTQNISQVFKMKYGLKDAREHLIHLSQLEKDLATTKVRQLKFALRPYIEKMSSNLSCLMARTADYCTEIMEETMGSCFVFPLAIDKTTNVICNHGLPLLHASWISLGLLGIFILLCMLMTSRIMAYMRGTEDAAKEWRSRITAKKFSSTQYVPLDENTKKFITL